MKLDSALNPTKTQASRQAEQLPTFKRKMLCHVLHKFKDTSPH